MRFTVVLLCSLFVAGGPTVVRSAELTQKAVLDSIERARLYLISEQNGDGSWNVRQLPTYQNGTTALVLLALVNAGQDVKSAPVQRALNYLRSEDGSEQTYDAAMMIMAYAAAQDSAGDRARIQRLAQALQQGQLRDGDRSGIWGYRTSRNAIDRGDRSNGQLAILALRDAAEMGIPVSRAVWERAQTHWRRNQNVPDGGWGYSQIDRRSTGSMTVAGIATLLITQQMLNDDPGVDGQGRPVCCRDPETDPHIERGLEWLRQNFTVRQNPARGSFVLYYLYGLERAGRLSGQRFFGSHDWYREGASFLLDTQSARGSWTGVGHGESEKIVGTSLALLFLSKGLSPVLINKLEFGPRKARRGEVIDNDWNQHPADVRRLTQLITKLPRWPKLVTSQVIDMEDLPRSSEAAVAILRQAPILYISGKENPAVRFSDSEIELLKAYLDGGGFIFAVRNCATAAFDDGFRQLVERLYPEGTATFKKLTGEHPVFRSEYPLDPESVELFGVDSGCRTTIIYSPEDLSCLWDKWAPYARENQPQSLKVMITRATRIGVNVVAYVTGRKPPTKLEDEDRVDLAGTELDRVERGFLRIATLRHEGGWDTAPKALRNLLIALNKTQGVRTSTVSRNVFAADPNVFRYPLIYMHGRHPFQFTKQEREQMRSYLERGGLLFADACCGSKLFDASFREFMADTFPEQPLKRISADHPLFHQPAGFGHEIRSVKRRIVAADPQRGTVESAIREGEPILEGIEIDGRLAVIYSQFDISCALERQSAVGCSGYLFEDALRLGINVVLFSMLQDASWRNKLEALQPDELVH